MLKFTSIPGDEINIGMNTASHSLGTLINYPVFKSISRGQGRILVTAHFDRTMELGLW